MQSTLEIVKGLLDDFIRYRWGDACALFLIIFGAWLVLHAGDETGKDLGKTLVGSGLASLRFKPMAATSSNGNGNGHPPDVTAAT